MEVEVIYTDFELEKKKAIYSARECYDSFHLSDDGGERDVKLLKRLAGIGHHSPMEQINITFSIKGVSRALLAQFSRHRMQSLNVKSTRFTIHKMIKEYETKDYYKYFVKHPNEFINNINRTTVKNVVSMLRGLGERLPNDDVKYLFPESLMTNITTSMNLRAFANFYKQRSDSHAMKEIQVLANKMFDLLDEDCQELVKKINNGE